MKADGRGRGGGGRLKKQRRAHELIAFSQSLFYGIEGHSGKRSGPSGPGHYSAQGPRLHPV
jgi:hypothetical protein